MKAILGFLGLTAFLAIATCKFCKVEEDCKSLNKDEAVDEFCCMAVDILALEGRGLCVRLAREGQKCHKPDSKIEVYGNKFIRYCPCKEGFECAPRTDKNYTDPATIRENNRCKKTSKEE